jgi:hypothetical protein
MANHHLFLLNATINRIKKGERFGRLTAVKFSGRNNSGNILWECICDCGKIAHITSSSLLAENQLSCGCIRWYLYDFAPHPSPRKTHGRSKTRIARIYGAMMERCYRKKNDNFQYYGGRGIKVCKEWRDDNKSFFNWADSSGYADNLTIDRKDTNGNYEPENCRWITQAEQSRNTRNVIFLTHEGRTLCLSEWAREFGIDPTTMAHRFRSGWKPPRLFLPKNQIKRECKPRPKRSALVRLRSAT